MQRVSEGIHRQSVPIVEWTMACGLPRAIFSRNKGRILELGLCRDYPLLFCACESSPLFSPHKNQVKSTEDRPRNRQCGFPHSPVLSSLSFSSPQPLRNAGEIRASRRCQVESYHLAYVRPTALTCVKSSRLARQFCCRLCKWIAVRTFWWPPSVDRFFFGRSLVSLPVSCTPSACSSLHF